jgi:hypothetical protein
MEGLGKKKANIKPGETPKVRLNQHLWLTLRHHIRAAYYEQREAMGRYSATRTGKLTLDESNYVAFGFVASRSSAGDLLELYSAGFSAWECYGAIQDPAPADVVKDGDKRQAKAKDEEEARLAKVEAAR